VRKASKPHTKFLSKGEGSFYLTPSPSPKERGVFTSPPTPLQRRGEFCLTPSLSPKKRGVLPHPKSLSTFRLGLLSYGR